jgi:hypothetical protein
MPIRAAPGDGNRSPQPVVNGYGRYSRKSAASGGQYVYRSDADQPYSLSGDGFTNGGEHAAHLAQR